MRTNLLNKHCTVPIAIIILSILNRLPSVCQPAKGGANDATVMKTTPRSFMFNCMFPCINPAFLHAVICLASHLVMGTTNEPRLSKCPIWIVQEAGWLNKLSHDIANNIVNHVSHECCHVWQELDLTVMNNIRSFMSIKIQSFLVLCILKSLLFHQLLCHGETEFLGIGCNMVDPGKQLDLDVLLQSFWHLPFNNLLAIQLCLLWYHLIVDEGLEFGRVHWPFVGLKVWVKFFTDYWIWLEGPGLCMRTMSRRQELPAFHPDPHPGLQQSTSPGLRPLWCLSSNCWHISMVPLVLNHHVQVSLDGAHPLCLQWIKAQFAGLPLLPLWLYQFGDVLQSITKNSSMLHLEIGFNLLCWHIQFSWLSCRWHPHMEYGFGSWTWSTGNVTHRWTW